MSSQALRVVGNPPLGAAPLAGGTVEIGVSRAGDALLGVGNSPVDGRGGGRQPPTPRADSSRTAITNRRSVRMRPRVRPLFPSKRLRPHLRSGHQGPDAAPPPFPSRRKGIEEHAIDAVGAIARDDDHRVVQFCLVLVTSLKPAAIMVCRGPKLIEDKRRVLVHDRVEALGRGVDDAQQVRCLVDEHKATRARPRRLRRDRPKSRSVDG